METEKGVYDRKCVVRVAGTDLPVYTSNAVQSQWVTAEAVAYNAEQWEARFGETCRKLKKQESAETAEPWGTEESDVETP